MAQGEPGAQREQPEAVLLEDAQAQAQAQAQPDASQAFSDIYLLYLGRVYSYLRSRTETSEDAEDLTQQVFVKALDALPKYRQRGLPFAAWLFRIARNVANDAYRRRRGSITVPWGSLPQKFYPVDPRNYEMEVLERQKHKSETEQIRALLKRLSPGDYELVTLRFFAELTLKEIAGVVKRSQGTVQRQMVRILRELKAQYKDEYKDE